MLLITNVVRKYLSFHGLTLTGGGIVLHGSKPVAGTAALQRLVALPTNAAATGTNTNNNNTNNTGNNNNNDGNNDGNNDDYGGTSGLDDDDEIVLGEEDDDDDQEGTGVKDCFALSFHVALVNLLRKIAVASPEGGLALLPALGSAVPADFKSWAATIVPLDRAGAAQTPVTAWELFAQALAWSRFSDSPHFAALLATVRQEWTRFSPTSRDVEDCIAREIAVGNWARAKAAGKRLAAGSHDIFFRMLHHTATSVESSADNRRDADALLGAAMTVIHNHEGKTPINVGDLITNTENPDCVAFRRHILFSRFYNVHSAFLTRLLDGVGESSGTVAGVSLIVDGMLAEHARYTSPGVILPWSSLPMPAPVVQAQVPTAIRHIRGQLLLLGRLLGQAFTQFPDDDGEVHDMKLFTRAALETADDERGARARAMGYVLSAENLALAYKNGFVPVALSTNGVAIHVLCRRYAPKTMSLAADVAAELRATTQVRDEYIPCLARVSRETRELLKTEALLTVPFQQWGAVVWEQVQGDFSKLPPEDAARITDLCLLVCGIDAFAGRFYKEYEVCAPLAKTLNIVEDPYRERHRLLIAHLMHASDRLFGTSLDPGCAQPGFLAKPTRVFDLIDRLKRGDSTVPRRCFRARRFQPFKSRPHVGCISRVYVSRAALASAIAAGQIVVTPTVNSQFGFSVQESAFVAGLLPGDQILDAAAASLRFGDKRTVRARWAKVNADNASWKKVQLRIFRASAAVAAPPPRADAAVAVDDVAYSVSKGAWRQALGLDQAKALAREQGRALWDEVFFAKQQADRDELRARGADFADLQDAIDAQLDLRRTHDVAEQVRALRAAPPAPGAGPMANEVAAVAMAVGEIEVVKRQFFRPSRVAAIQDADRRRRRFLARLADEIVAFAGPATPSDDGSPARVPVVVVGAWAIARNRRGGTAFPFKALLELLGRRCAVVVACEHLSSASCFCCGSYVGRPRRFGSSSLSQGTSLCSNTDCPAGSLFFNRDLSGSCAIALRLLYRVLWGGSLGICVFYLP